MESTDKSLIEAHCQGDPLAFGELVRRYGDSILGYLMRMSGNHHQAEDLFQETFKRVHEKPIRFAAVYLRAGFLPLRRMWLLMVCGGADGCRLYR